MSRSGTRSIIRIFICTSNTINDKCCTITCVNYCTICLAWGVTSTLKDHPVVSFLKTKYCIYNRKYRKKSVKYLNKFYVVSKLPHGKLPHVNMMPINFYAYFCIFLNKGIFKYVTYLFLKFDLEEIRSVRSLAILLSCSHCLMIWCTVQ